ncbi:MAG: hypothetical protein PV344_03455 [Anaplasma sp.]|nr:hypothetical protein [Anaplasma sp.]
MEFKPLVKYPWYLKYAKQHYTYCKRLNFRGLRFSRIGTKLKI